MSERVMNEQKQAVLSCRNLGKRYEQGPESVEVLSGLQLELFPGQRVAIVGSSGSGKSTLLNLLGGLDTPSEGSVWLAGEELSALNEKDRGLLRNRALGFVYQFHHLLAEFTALENVCMPLRSCPAVSVSAWPSLGHWSTSLRWYCSMSQPATSIITPRRAFRI